MQGFFGLLGGSDGYEEKFYIAATPKIHDAVRGRRRPMTIDERSEFLQLAGQQTIVQQQRAAAAWMAKQIIDWNVPIKPKDIEKSYNRLPFPLFSRLWNIVLGNDGGDDDPEDSKKQSLQLAETKAEAEAAGVAPQDVADARDLGNS